MDFLRAKLRGRTIHASQGDYIRAYQEEHADQRDEAAKYEARASKEGVETWCLEVARPKSRHCVTKNLVADGGTKYAEHDLEAQQDMAEWAYALFLSSIAGIVISGLGLGFVGIGLFQNAHANRQAREFFIAERRAWLNVTPAANNAWSLEDGVGRFSVNLVATNIGLSPALHVYFHIPASGQAAFTGDDLAQFRTSIARHKQSRQGETVGPTIFPGTPLNKSGTVFAKVPSPVGGQFFVPVFVSYRIAGSDDVHVTPLVFQIGYATYGQNVQTGRVIFQTLHDLAPEAD